MRETQDTLAKRSEQCRQLYDIVGTLEQRLGHLPEQPDNAPAHHAKGGGGGGDGAMGAGSHGQVPAVLLIYGGHIRQTYQADISGRHIVVTRPGDCGGALGRLFV